MFDKFINMVCFLHLSSAEAQLAAIASESTAQVTAQAQKEVAKDSPATDEEPEAVSKSI